MKQIWEDIRSAPEAVQLLALGIFLVGMHSLILGAFIYTFTELFYRLFFQAAVENFFFVKQSGLFLFCLSLFYLLSLADLKHSRRLVNFIILTKILAVQFLLLNARIAVRPGILLLAASLDGVMAVVLICLLQKTRSTLRSR